jgi:LysM repeat protein
VAEVAAGAAPRDAAEPSWRPFALVAGAVLTVATGLTLAVVQVTPRAGAVPTVAVRVPAASTPAPAPSAAPSAAASATPRGVPAAPASGGQRPRYVVYRGQTLSALAARFGTTVAALVRLNGIGDPDLIYPGQRIRVR